jgi:capsid protein
MAVEIAERTLENFRPNAGYGYEGAAAGRRWKGTTLSNASADVTATGAANRLRARFRDLVRNNPQAARAIRTMTSQIIGTGIVGHPKDTELRSEFSLWCNSLSADVGTSDEFLRHSANCHAHDHRKRIRSHSKTARAREPNAERAI